MQKIPRRPDFVMKQNVPQARLIKHNAPQTNILE